MWGRPVLLDANVLVLFCVGLASRAYVPIHKRLSKYSARDYDLLRTMVASAAAVTVTPNVLTEATNLARQIADPACTRIAETFRRVTENTSETYIPSRLAVQSPAYVRLGLTDAGMLDSKLSNCVLLTDDLGLFLEAGRLGRQAVNFTHYLEANR